VSPTPKPSPPPSPAPTPLPSNSPTAGFVESGSDDGSDDFSLEDDGTTCDDEPTKKWAKKDKSCESKRDWIEVNKKDVCKKNDEWVLDGICRQTCWELGSKFAYGDCGVMDEPTISPSAEPSLAPTVFPSFESTREVNAIVCEDVPTKQWAKKKKSCDDKRAWIEDNKKDVCKKSDDWIAAKTCERTCFDLGPKYAYGDCGACVDSPSWSGKKSAHTCADYVAKKPERCKAKVANEAGVSSLDACPATCGTCPSADVDEACADDSTWWTKESKNTCGSYVAKKPRERCKAKVKDDSGVSAIEACPETCGACGF